MRRPTATLTLDGSSLTAPEAGLSALQVELGTNGAHDRFRATVSPGSRAAQVQPGSSAAVALGYDGDGQTTVLTGMVTSVVRRPTGAVIEGLAGTAALSASWVGRSYLSQTVADIVNDLVSSAGASAGEIAAPLSLAAYHVDERRTIWSHVRTLATLAGAELSADGEGALNLRPARAAAASSITLHYGAHVLEWDLGPCDPQPIDVTVVPFGAASEEGSEKWHVLLKEPEGSSPTSPTLIPGALRDRDGAQALQDELKKAGDRRGLQGSMLVEGDATVRAGDVVELQGMPNGEDGPFRVAAAQHRFGRGGYLTLLRVGAAA